MISEDRKNLDFLLEQNKELKDALNNQIDKIFTLEEENQSLQEEIEELKTREFEILEKTNRSYSEKLSTIKEAEDSLLERGTNDAATQTFEFDDPFEQELVEIQREEEISQLDRSTFKYSLTNYSRSTYQTIFDVENGEGKSFAQIENEVLKNFDQKSSLDFGKIDLKKHTEENPKEAVPDLKAQNEIEELRKKVEGMTEEIMESNKTNLRLKKEIQKLERIQSDIDELKSEYEKKIEKKDGKISELKDEILKVSNMVNEQTYTDIKTLQLNKEKSENSVKELRAQLNQSKTVINEYQERMKMLVENSEALKKAMFGMREEYGSLKSENERFKHVISNMEKEIQQGQEFRKEHEGSEGDKVRLDETLVENNYLKDLTGQLKTRLERAIKDLEFYRKIVRDHKIRQDR